MDKKFRIVIPIFDDNSSIFKEFRIPHKIRNKFDIEVYGSLKNCIWNGGRVNTSCVDGGNEVIGEFNKIGISVNIIFSNFEIDLKDSVGIGILESLKKYQEKYGVRNKVTLVNEDFRIFLIKNYDFDLKFSITGHKNITKNDLEDTDKILQYYNELEEKYDIIVPQSELVVHPWFYQNINNKKYEPIINIVACCSYCPIYEEHYEIISSTNRAIGNTELDSYLLKRLRLLNECMLKNPEQQGQWFTFSDLEIIFNNYYNFKLEGRGDSFEEWNYNGWEQIYAPALKYICGENQNSTMYRDTKIEIEKELG